MYSNCVWLRDQCMNLKRNMIIYETSTKGIKQNISIPCSSTFEFNLHFTNVRVKLALYHFEAFVTRPACFRIFSIWLLHMFVKQLCQLPAGSTTQKQGKIGMDME